MSELALGMRACASFYGAKIIGGDTIGGSKLDLSITVVSSSVHPLLRQGLKIGDWIAHTGYLGKSMRQLRYLMAGGRVHSRSRFVAPVLRRDFVHYGRQYLRCGMDISDGLTSDVSKLCRLNRLGIAWNHRINKRVACSGEEYEMLFAFHPKKLQALQCVAKRTRTPFTVIGKAVRGKFTNRCKAHHF
jgi:thiamine-monophosphate kinase